ncbi:MAG: sulfotransferase [Dehalococcoidia bacterium]
MAERENWIIVTGTGRSGTSAVATVLHESGISMGTTFDAASKHNARGFYEDLHALEINERIFADAGLADLRLAPELPSRETFLAAAEPYADEMRRVAAMGARGWKDPRFCFTLEAWMRALDARPQVIACLRGPEAYLHSVMMVVGLIERDVAEAWWTRHLERLLEVIEAYELDAHCVDYDALLADPARTVDALSRFAGQPLDASYVDPSLRSHAYPLARSHRALYRRVLALGANGDAPVLDPPCDAATIAAYVRAAEAAERRFAAAQRTWEDAVDIETIASLRGQELAAARDACLALEATLGEAKSLWLALTPPDQFEREHELLRDAIDLSRMTGLLLSHACDGIEPDADVIERAREIWRRVPPRSGRRSLRFARGHAFALPSSVPLPRPAQDDS